MHTAVAEAHIYYKEVAAQLVIREREFRNRLIS